MHFLIYVVRQKRFLEGKCENIIEFETTFVHFLQFDKSHTNKSDKKT